MKHGGKLLAGMLGVLALGTASAVTPDTPEPETGPYQDITTRNLFALKPPPPPPSPEDTKPPPSNITLTGITTFLGKKALMKTPPPPARPGSPPGTVPTERFYMLSEGERDGDIQVLTIDEKNGSVRVMNSGVETTLTFEKNGPKLPTTPVAAMPVMPGGPVMPGALPAPGGVVPPPAMPGTFVPSATGIKPTFPVRPMRGNQYDATGNPTPGYQPAAGTWPGLPAPSTTPSAVPLPGFNTTQQQNPAALSQAAMPDKLYTPEEQAILIEANRAKSPFGALLPPTPLNRGNIEGVNQNPGTGQAQQNQNPVNFPPLPGRAIPPFPGGQ